MNATLWVIWISAVVLSGSIGLAVGGWYFPSEERLAEARRDGYEQGCDDEQASCAPCERPCCAPWDDTPDSLALQAQPYYEPLAALDAALSAPHVAGVDPGPGPVIVPRLGDFITAPAFDVVFVPANPGPPPDLELPIFSQLATSWPQLAAPLACRPGGVAPEPPVREVMPHEPRDRAPVAHMSPPAPAMVPGEMPGQASSSLHETAGAGADPWQEIVAANQEVWEPFTDTDVFTRIGSDLSALRSALAAPIELPPWKDSQ